MESVRTKSCPEGQHTTEEDFVLRSLVTVTAVSELLINIELQSNVMIETCRLSRLFFTRTFFAEYTVAHGQEISKFHHSFEFIMPR